MSHTNGIDYRILKLMLNSSGVCVDLVVGVRLVVWRRRVGLTVDRRLQVAQQCVKHVQHRRTFQHKHEVSMSISVSMCSRSKHPAMSTLSVVLFYFFGPASASTKLTGAQNKQAQEDLVSRPNSAQIKYTYFKHTLNVLTVLKKIEKMTIVTVSDVNNTITSVETSMNDWQI